MPVDNERRELGLISVIESLINEHANDPNGHWFVLSDGHTSVSAHVPLADLETPSAILRAIWLEPLLEAWLGAHRGQGSKRIDAWGTHGWLG